MPLSQRPLTAAQRFALVAITTTGALTSVDLGALLHSRRLAERGTGHDRDGRRDICRSEGRRMGECAEDALARQEYPGRNLAARAGTAPLTTAPATSRPATYPKGAMNLCTTCGLDFTGVDDFDSHRVGKHAYLYAEGLAMYPPREDGRRCLDLDEMVAAGWYQDRRGRWAHPRRVGKAARRPDSLSRTRREGY